MNRKVKRSVTLILALVLVLAMLPMPMAQAATLKQGSSGSTVRNLQINLIGLGYLTDAADSSFGPKTTAAVKAFQADYGLKVDGIAGPETLSKTPTISDRKNRNHSVVKAVQLRLQILGYNCDTTGVADTKFTAAVVAFQEDNKCWADGEITARNKTWKKLLGMEG